MKVISGFTISSI